MKYRADLHCHSTCSDGTYSPFEIINLAKEKEIGAISITDHDTISAYTPTFFEYAKKRGVHVVTGVEFSCVYENIGIHLLGLNVDINSSEIQTFCQLHMQRRYERNMKILENLHKQGITILESELYQDQITTSIGRVHIAKLLLQKGKVKTISEAFNKWIGDEAPCFSRGNGFSVQETIDVIHKASGKAFLAHPHLVKPKKIIKPLIMQHAFDGIECYYANFPKHENDRWLNMAKKNSLLISGGSDFHGSVKPHNKLGSAYIDEEALKSIELQNEL